MTLLGPNPNRIQLVCCNLSLSYAFCSVSVYPAVAFSVSLNEIQYQLQLLSAYFVLTIKKYQNKRIRQKNIEKVEMTVAKCTHVTCPCVSTFLSLCSYLFLNPCLHGSLSLPFVSTSSRLFTHCLCLLSPSSS